MNKVKGIEKLTEILQKFVKKFGCDIEVGEEFSYYYDDALINYSLIIPVFSDKVWKEYVLKTFNYKIKNIFMFSLLHEIGHHMTYDLYTEKDCKKEDETIKKIEKALACSTSYATDKNLNLAYFNLPMEKTATKWAVRYYKTHSLEMELLWRKFKRELKKFYKINGLKDN